MLKFVIVGLAVALLLWWVFGRAPRKTPTARPRPRKDDGAEPMVACAHCGVHLPREDALAARGLHYCSAAHRDTTSPQRPGAD
jgi:uncharacterized protein